MELSDVTKFLYFSGIIVWLLPPIRQFNNSLFYFFLILALGDSISLAYVYLLGKSIPLGYYVVLDLLTIISLTNILIVKRYKYLFIVVGVVVTISLFILQLNTSSHYVLLALLNSVVFIMILKIFIMNYVDYSKINLFLMILLFYQTTILFKLLNMALGFADATAFFIITGIAQIIFGLYFSIVRADRPESIIKL